MNDLPRQALYQIVARHGRSVANEARRVEGLLRDYCGGYRREIAVLVSAVEEHVTAELLALGGGLPRQALLARLAHRLHDNVAMDTAAAKWAVSSWALALSVITNTELEAMEREQIESATALIPTAAVQTTLRVEPQQMMGRTSMEIVVSASGGGDFTSLSQALKAATSGSRLLVRPGLYREGIVLNKPVEIIGESEQQQVIITSAKASCILMQADHATVRGLTLRQEQGAGNEDESFFAVDIPQGRLRLEDCDITSRSLSCIGIHNDSTDPIIRRCRIHTSADSGIYIFNAAAGVVEDCDIHDNNNVGVAITERANPTIRRCSIRAGKDAGIVSWNDGLGVLEECEISGNVRAGIGVSEKADLSIRRCRIYDGANSGVFVHNDGQATLEDCDIYGHEQPEMAASLGGKIIARGCSIHIGKGSGVLIDGGGVAILDHCDVQSNAGAGISVNADGVASVNECHINRNSGAAVRVQSGGKVIVENCDLTRNLSGPWEAGRGAVIKEMGNQS